MADYDVPPQRRAELPPKSGFGYARALYDNIPDNEGELGFKKGDVLRVLLMPVDRQGWWKCSLNGMEGLCPGNRLQLLAGKSGAESGPASQVDVQAPFPRKPSPANRQVMSQFEDYDYPKTRTVVEASADDGPVEDYDTPQPVKSVFAGDPVRGLPSDREESSDFSVFAGDQMSRADYDVPLNRDEYDHEVNCSLGSSVSSMSLNTSSRRSILHSPLGLSPIDRLMDPKDSKLISYVSSQAGGVTADLLRARHALGASAARGKPPPVMVLDAKDVVLAAHKGLQLACLLARRIQSETIVQYSTEVSDQLLKCIKDIKECADNVERYFPSAPVVNQLVSQAEKTVNVFKEFAEVLVEVSSPEEGQ